MVKNHILLEVPLVVGNGDFRPESSCGGATGTGLFLLQLLWGEITFLLCVCQSSLTSFCFSDVIRIPMAGSRNSLSH